jgi:hypothetical protein
LARRGVELEGSANGKQRRVEADQLWAKRKKKSANALVLDDYRYWVNEMEGLTPGYE